MRLNSADQVCAEQPIMQHFIEATAVLEEISFYPDKQSGYFCRIISIDRGEQSFEVVPSVASQHAFTR